MNIVEIITPK